MYGFDLLFVFVLIAEMTSLPWPVLRLRTNAVQLTVPLGDHGQLMSLSLPPPSRLMA